MPTGTRADRLDEAIAGLLAGGHPNVDAELAPLVDAAALVRAAMPPLPVGTRFRSRLETRLVHRRRLARAAAAIARLTQRELRHPARVIVAGAISSAAIGVGVTAFAVWRVSHRHGAAGPRPVDR